MSISYHERIEKGRRKYILFEGEFRGKFDIIILAFIKHKNSFLTYKFLISEIEMWKRGNEEIMNRKKKQLLFYITLIAMSIMFFTTVPVNATGNRKNLVIVLDPGHGGEEDGANYYGLEEKDLNLKLAKMVQQSLQEYQGVDVMLTREGDEEVTLWERANCASKMKADIFLSMHFNASMSHKSNGSSVYISTGEYHKDNLMKLGDNLLGEFESIGLKNAGMFARVTQMNGRRADGSFEDYYGVLRHAYNHGIPAMIIEHCYMDSEIDKDYFDTDEGLEKLAQADVNAIAAYYGLCKTGEEVPVAKHATVFGATSKAVERNYYEAPLLKNISILEYDNKTPGIATYQVEVQDGVGVSTIYLVYKNVVDGSTFTIYLNLEESLETGVHEVTAYFPSNLSLGECELSYVGVYNEVGFDAGYNHYGDMMIGYGKCDWLNTFSYVNEADLNIMEVTDISPIKADYIIDNIRKQISYKRTPFIKSSILGR